MRVGILIVFPICAWIMLASPPVPKASADDSVTKTTETLTTIPNALMQWYEKNWTPTAVWPTGTSPIWKQPLKVQERLACVRYYESRNHLGETSSAGAQGLYQFMPQIWAYAKVWIPDLPDAPNRATSDQQDEVAIWYYNRNGGLYPEWTDNC